VRLCEFEELEYQGKDVKVSVNSKEEISEDFCLNFAQEFGLWKDCSELIFDHY
jgi:hypothetical protein